MPIGKLCPGFKLLVERRTPRPSQSLSRLRMVGKQEVICYLRIARHAQGEILCDIDLSWGD